MADTWKTFELGLGLQTLGFGLDQGQGWIRVRVRLGLGLDQGQGQKSFVKGEPWTHSLGLTLRKLELGLTFRKI